MARSPLPVPGPNDLWGQRLNDAIETTGFDDMADFDTSGGVADGAAPRYSVVDEKWYPEVSPDMARFRGDWQDPANTLLWSTDFSDPADFELFTLPSGSFRPLERRNIAGLTGLGAAPLDFDFCIYSTGAQSGVYYTGFRLDFTSVPELGANRFISYVKVFDATTISNTATSFQYWAESQVEAGARHDWKERTVPVNRELSVLDTQWGRVSPGGSWQMSYGITGLRIYGAVSVEDLYQLGEIVSYSGKYYRSLYNNNGENPTNTSYWALVPSPAKSLSAKLENLLDVSTYGRADQSYLQWDAATQLYRHVMAPDYLNFKGDWQVSTEMLLWSSDMSDPLKVSSLKGVTSSGATTAESGSCSSQTVASIGASSPPAGFGACATWSGTSASSAMTIADSHPQIVIKPALIPALAGKLLSKVEFWTPVGGDRTSGAITINGSDVGSGWTGTIGGSKVWTEITKTLGLVNTDIRIHNWKNSGFSAEGRTVAVTGLRFYGMGGAYSINDVVSYSGIFYRSLYDNNTEEPGIGSKWYPIPALTP